MNKNRLPFYMPAVAASLLALASPSLLADVALTNDYGKKCATSGPLFHAMKAESDKIRLEFPHYDGGLIATPVPATYNVRLSANKTAPLVRNSPQSELEGFALCGEDHK